MWPGQQQPPGGEHQPQQPNPYQQPGYDQSGQPGQSGQSGYQQPGYQQPNPYQQPGYQSTGQQAPYGQQPQWGAQGPAGPPVPPGGGGGNRTKLVAIIAATAVVVAAGVTGFLVLGGDGNKDKKTQSAPTASPSPTVSESTEDNPRGDDAGAKPTVAGWKVVVNPKWGTAFDVPAEWAVQSSDTFIGFEDDKKGDGSVLIGMSAPAVLKEKWCTSDDDKDGNEETSSLAAVGTKGQQGAKGTEDIARNDSAWWIFGGYTDQKDSSKKKMTIGKAKAYTTTSGVEGSVATTYSKGVAKKGKCDTDGKATTFAFKNSAGDYVSWTFHGAKDVGDEVPDATVQKILSTVRLYGEPTGG
ncbi:hypothetical protein PV733_24370 [Streptomyces europaeiscabiei]|uniref:hypothetical protein n=1 Tax=Streptomyces europaeiscabiei TaxID=146819 RepID=UPI0029A45305|nr:hypothetical protein [Streptomyces europaeiscabiei]MDX2761776.1 hypothetical protein [Streptomyces europaeiscabiei]MDX3712029.1 hypothetical protein [Streptomyces europaeiscabiei]